MNRSDPVEAGQLGPTTGCKFTSRAPQRSTVSATLRAPLSVDPTADRRDNDRARGDNNSTRGDNNGSRSCDAARSVDTGGAVDYRARFRRRESNEPSNEQRWDDQMLHGVLPVGSSLVVFPSVNDPMQRN